MADTRARARTPVVIVGLVAAEDMLSAGQDRLFITLQGGADDQLFRGDNVSRRMDATVTMRTDARRNEYRFALAHAHPDRFMFVDEAFRFNRASIDEEQD